MLLNHPTVLLVKVDQVHLHLALGVLPQLLEFYILEHIILQAVVVEFGELLQEVTVMMLLALPQWALLVL